MKTRLNKKEILSIISVADRIDALRAKLDPDETMTLECKENGTIGGCLGVALASLDSIIQEYL